MLSSSSSRLILRLVRCVMWMVDGHDHHVQCSGDRRRMITSISRMLRMVKLRTEDTSC